MVIVKINIPRMRPFNTLNLSLQDQLSLVSLPIYIFNMAHYQLSIIVILDESEIFRRFSKCTMTV